MPKEAIDWERVKAALFQSERRYQFQGRAEAVMEILPALIGVCGDFSATRKMAYRVGEILLQETPVIIAPSCPDYGYENGRYTFRGLQGGVSLVAQCHIAFIEKIQEFLPKVKPFILYADHEADDPELCARVGKTREEFLALVQNSITETRAMVESKGWKAKMMTEEIPDLVAQEHAYATQIASEPNYRQRITTDTTARAEMYQRINGRLTFEEMRMRTIATAAQYVAMGQYATRQKYLICNHTTVNLASWYLQTGAAVLHNPVSVY